MHIHFLDPFQALRSPIHTLDARVKLLLTLGFVLTCSISAFGQWPVYVLLLAMMLSAEILSGLGPWYVIRRSVLALPFALAALPVLFTSTGWPLFAVGIGGTSFVATAAGLSRFLSILLKSWLSLQAAILLTATTPFPDLLRALRAIGAPPLLVALFGLMWRYLFVLGDEALRLMRARSARSGHLENARSSLGGTLGWRARVTGNMAGSVLVRAFERSDRIYAAMLARGYDGEVRSLPRGPINTAGWIILAIGLLAFVVLLVLGAILGS